MGGRPCACRPSLLRRPHPLAVLSRHARLGRPVNALRRFRRAFPPTPGQPVPAPPSAPQMAHPTTGRTPPLFFPPTPGPDAPHRSGNALLHAREKRRHGKLRRPHHCGRKRQKGRQGCPAAPRDWPRCLQNVEAQTSTAPSQRIQACTSAASAHRGYAARHSHTVNPPQRNPCCRGQPGSPRRSRHRRPKQW